jgi:hypothetical protein
MKRTRGGIGRPASHLLVSYRLRPEPGPVGAKVDPLGEELGASELPDGFMVLFVGLLTAPVRLPGLAVLPVVPVDGEVGEAVVAPPPIPPPADPPPAAPPV